MLYKKVHYMMELYVEESAAADIHSRYLVSLRIIYRENND